MSERKALFWTVTALGILAVIGLISYLSGDDVMPQIVSGDQRTIVLEMQWGGDVHVSQEPSCDVWTAQFNCELRHGGDLGVVISQTLPLIGPIAAPDPPETGTVVTTTLTWDTSVLAVGPYETFCRLEETNGTDIIFGYVEGDGHDGDYFHLADKFAVGQMCIVPRRFIATVQ